MCAYRPNQLGQPANLQDGHGRLVRLLPVLQILPVLQLQNGRSSLGLKDSIDDSVPAAGDRAAQRQGTAADGAALLKEHTAAKVCPCLCPVLGRDSFSLIDNLSRIQTLCSGHGLLQQV